MLLTTALVPDAHTFHCFSQPILSKNKQWAFLTTAAGCLVKNFSEAMCYGSSAAEAARSENDLGRFGLGLKAASLSQCRILTVVSMQDGDISAYSWDYNYILKHKKWFVNELTIDEISNLPYIENLREAGKTNDSGTLVIWEDFDVLESRVMDRFSALFVN